jgi:hypothetical protein
MGWNLPDGCTQDDIDRAAGYWDEPEQDDEPDLMENWDPDEDLPKRCRHCGEWDDACDCCPKCGCPNDDCKHRQVLANVDLSLPCREPSDAEDGPF